LRRGCFLEHVHDPFEIIFGERVRRCPLVVVLLEELIILRENIILTRDALLDRLGEPDKGLRPLKGGWVELVEIDGAFFRRRDGNFLVVARARLLEDGL
jgi:hypothetical protein